MIDQGSGADVMYPNLFKGLGLKREDLSKYDTPLVGFDGRMVIPQEQISLPVKMEGNEVVLSFIVVGSFSPYTAILGRPCIHAMEAVPSTLHVKVKFPTEQGVAVIRGSQQMARQCLVTAINRKSKQAKEKEIADEAPFLQLQEPREGMGTGCAAEPLKIKILPDVDRYFQIGASLKDEDKVGMLLFLIQNVDVFSWSPGWILSSSSIGSMWTHHFLPRNKNREDQLRSMLRQLSWRLTD